MTGPDVCSCVVAALVHTAPEPGPAGRFFVCRTHGQMILWDGRTWSWSNQPDDIEQLPLLADSVGTPPA
ncbi:hypothetical protein ACFRMO_08060 [Streptomyces anulatus]|uniref:hypothetical protein n=1 Tax=Streptomyces anulatus TaxID=1892 RepID=UPI0036C2B8C4